jgi:hypothetical protein
MRRCRLYAPHSASGLLGELLALTGDNAVDSFFSSSTSQTRCSRVCRRADSKRSSRTGSFTKLPQSLHRTVGFVHHINRECKMYAGDRVTIFSNDHTRTFVLDPISESRLCICAAFGIFQRSADGGVSAPISNIGLHIPEEARGVAVEMRGMQHLFLFSLSGGPLFSARPLLTHKLSL